jgi:hypothetical protein
VKLRINVRKYGELSNVWKGTTISLETVAGAVGTGFLANTLNADPMFAIDLVGY